MVFGPWLQQMRRARHLTQGELARRVDCSYALLRMIEGGQRSCSAQIAERLTRALDILA